MFANMDYVYEVYKEGSFSKAAANLYISQPALSATVKKIEKKIGMPLFDRSTVPVQLTECGKKYMKTAEKIMDLEEDFQGGSRSEERISLSLLYSRRLSRSSRNVFRRLS